MQKLYRIFQENLRFGESPFSTKAALVGAVFRFGVLSDKRLEAVLAQAQRGLIVRQKQAEQEADIQQQRMKIPYERGLVAQLDVIRRRVAVEKQQRSFGRARSLRSLSSHNLVFTVQFGRYINNKTLWMNFKRIVSGLGMPELRFHDLRHTFSINSLQAGDDIKTVQENLGHATAAFTLSTYAHATMGMKRESANRIDAFIRSVRESGETHRVGA